MDDLKRRRAMASMQDAVSAKYDPTEDLDPMVAQKIRQMQPSARPMAVDAAYDDAGVYAKLKRMLKGAYDDDIYNKK